jgi:hypothetical protein
VVYHINVSYNIFEHIACALTLFNSLRFERLRGNLNNCLVNCLVASSSRGNYRRGSFVDGAFVIPRNQDPRACGVVVALHVCLGFECE